MFISFHNYYAHFKLLFIQEDSDLHAFHLKCMQCATISFSIYKAIKTLHWRITHLIELAVSPNVIQLTISYNCITRCIIFCLELSLHG